ncbi:oxidoreductase, partial [Rhizobium ruizarguesonis]
RAIGGAARIVVGPMPAHPAAVLTRGSFLPGDDSVIPHFSKVTTAIKENVAVAIQQLYQCGWYEVSESPCAPTW